MPLSGDEIKRLFTAPVEALHYGKDMLGYRLADVFNKTEIPLGNNEPVIFIPAYIHGDSSLSHLKEYFEKHKYQGVFSKLGLNVFFNKEKAENLVNDVQDLSEQEGQPVYLVGHSKGGVIARELARRLPDHVAGYVTMGSPLNAAADKGHAARLARSVYKSFHPEAEYLEPQDIADAMAEPVQAHGLHFYSKEDRIVKWQHCIGPGRTNIRVSSAHIGMALDPEVIQSIGHHFDIIRKNPDFPIGTAGEVAKRLNLRVDPPSGPEAPSP